MKTDELDDLKAPPSTEDDDDYDEYQPHQTARRFSPFNVKKEEVNDYKGAALNASRSISREREDSASSDSTIQVKTEFIQEEEEDMVKAFLHSSSGEHLHNLCYTVANQSSDMETTSTATSGHSDYYCRKCDIAFKSLKEVLDHRKATHNTRSTKIKHINIEPDVNDPNNYCKSCESYYSSRYLYRGHLRATHHMVLGTEVWTKPRADVHPDPQDPNAYCRSCQRFYSNQGVYREHLKTVHKADLDRLRPVRNTDMIPPDWNDPNLHCSSCDSTFKSRPPIKKSPRKTDLVLNNYCNVCKRSYKHTKAYRAHCKKVHGLEPVKFANPNVAPDINDPDNYCKTCDKHMSSKTIFKSHLRLIHSVDETVSKHYGTKKTRRMKK
ncbi:hypothetical protein MBANPS3_009501 [Mucor bainieri]